ncbi:fibronectin-binding protein RevA [Borreliella afzelii]
MQNKNIVKLFFFILFIMSCELYYAHVTDKTLTNSPNHTIDKKKINFMLVGVSDLNNKADESVFKQFKKKIALLKEDLRGAINADELKEKFLNLQKLFQEKLTDKLNALKAAKRDIEELIRNNNTDKSKIRAKTVPIGVSTTLAEFYNTDITELSKDIVAQINDIIKYLEED